MATYFDPEKPGPMSVCEAICAQPCLVPPGPSKNAGEQLDGKIEKENKRNIDGKAPKQRDHGSILHVENLAIILAKVN
jgi:hypothetical protein